MIILTVQVHFCAVLIIHGILCAAASECLPNVSIQSRYKVNVAVARGDEAVERLLVTHSVYCTTECNTFNGCESVNAISNESNSQGVVCELFNSSSSFQNQNQYFQWRNSTYYEALNFTPPKDCLEISQKSSKNKNSGIHTIMPSINRKISAYCDMGTADGGWTLLQRRFDGNVDFYLDWESYKNGFGDLNDEFWLGLENAHHLMKDTNTTLRFDLWNGTGHRYQEYYEAMIANKDDNYRLQFKGSSGTAGDAMSERAKDQMFTTKDRDNDMNANQNCAAKFKGAWWYSACHFSNLNGIYGSNAARGNIWSPNFAQDQIWYAMTKTEIKMKRSFQSCC